MRNGRKRGAVVVLAAMLPLIAACGGEEETRCNKKNLAIIKAVNNGAEAYKVIVDGASEGIIQPAGEIKVEVPAGTAHTVEFLYASDDVVACPEETTAALGECIQLTLTCSA